MNISRLMDEADLDEQFEEIQSEWACNLPNLVLEFVETFLKGEGDG